MPAVFALPFLVVGMLQAASPSSAPRQMEYLGRGVVAVLQPDGKVFVSWRVLGTDPDGLAFNLYRKTESPPVRGGGGFGWRRPGGMGGFPVSGEPVKLNDQPIAGPTWFLDSRASLGGKTSYFVRPVLDGVEQEAGTPFVFQPNPLPLPYLSIPLQPITNCTPGDASAGDLDGDGEYEIVLMQTGRGRDNSQAGRTDPSCFQAYKLDGTLLWTIHLGPNIRSGAHYTQFIVYDFDGDGRAELACKTADGTVDGTGKVIGDAKADHVNAQGHVVRGPEFLTIFDGRTGAALATTNYVPGRHPARQDPTPEELNSIWGDGRANRSERYLACAAYLDGARPSLVMCRGYYTRTVLVAWDWREGRLTQRWIFDSDDSVENRKYRGQGNHNLSVADVDGDGRDEIIYGAAVIDDNGHGLYSTGRGHGDAMHVSDLDPDRPGLEVFMVHEAASEFGAGDFRDARTGEMLWCKPSEDDAGRGMTANIDPRYKGSECWSAPSRNLYSARGEIISRTRPRSVDFAVWWDGDFLRELLDRNIVTKWNWQDGTESTLLIAQGASSINGTKATPALSADLFGDWREEILLRSNDGKELRIYTTTYPTPHRLFTLMHDPQYRLAIAWQNVAYNQPPHPSFYLDDNAPLPPRPNIVTPRCAPVAKPEPVKTQ